MTDKKAASREDVIVADPVATNLRSVMTKYKAYIALYYAIPIIACTIFWYAH
jgi:hypothetical protein